MRPAAWMLAVTLYGCAAAPSAPAIAAPRRVFHDAQVTSRYVAMRDGVRLAIDVLLPQPLGPDDRLPVLFTMSRFGRSQSRGALSDEDRFWIEHGFVRVLIDERGTGASFGTSRFGPDEVPDLYDLADWAA